MADHSILGICGALRSGSTNRRLLEEARRIYGPASYSEADLHLPLYDGDMEMAEGIPPSVQRLADQIAAADAVIIATPEYNKALPGVLKNALDWVSRLPGKSVWAGKPVAIMSAAAGRTGGETSQFTLRHCMTVFNPRILQGPAMAIAASGSAFDEDGLLQDERSTKALTALMEALRADVALFSQTAHQ